MSPTDLMTTAQAAQYLNVTDAHLERLRSKASIERHIEAPPYVKIGGLVRYSRRALDRWLDLQMGMTEPEPSTDRERRQADYESRLESL